MSADTTPVILVTSGENGGKEYRPAIVQEFHTVWITDDEGETLDSSYVVDRFREATVASSLEDAQRQLDDLILDWRAQYLSIEYDQELLDLEAITFAQLEEQAKLWGLHGFDALRTA